MSSLAGTGASSGRRPRLPSPHKTTCYQHAALRSPKDCQQVPSLSAMVRIHPIAIARRTCRPMSGIGNHRQWDAPTRPTAASLKPS